MFTNSELIQRQAARCDFVAAPAVTASSAYAANNTVGAKFKIGDSSGVNGPFKESWLSAKLSSIVVLDKSNQKPAMDLIIFNKNPAGTFADKTNFAPAAADALAIIARIPIASADFVTYDSGGVHMAIAQSANQANLGRIIKPDVATALAEVYGLLVTSGTPTFASTSDIQLRLQFGF